MKKPTERFTEKAHHYDKHRPDYPAEVLTLLRERCHLPPTSILADIGSGTGIFTKQLLEKGYFVFGVEPNHAMRLIAESKLKDYPKFKSVAGTAEKTTLQSSSVDAITVATAFHWFEQNEVKKEFTRILQPDGWVILIWNVRNYALPLIREYENLLIEFCTDYLGSRAQEFEKTAVADFFYPHKMHHVSFPNKQILNWDGLKGRLQSTSYCLTPHDKHYEDMITKLKKIFNRYKKNEHINFEYMTEIYFGKLSSGVV